MSSRTVLKAAIAAGLPIAAILLGWSPVAAPAKIAGTFNAKYAEQHPLNVPDAEGHSMVLGRVQGTNRSTGPTPYMDGAAITSLEFGDLVQGNGPHQGYVSFVQGPDTSISKWSGKVTTTLSPDKTPITTFQGTWTKVKGSSRYEGATGRGTYQGRFISQNEYTVDWKGELSGAKLAQK